MINLYYRDYPIQHGINKSPSWDVLRNKYIEDLINIKYKYMTMEKRVNSNHIISRIIKHIDIDITKNIFEYVSILETTAKYTIKNFNVSSNINQGRVVRDEIISNTDSLIIESNFDVDLFNLEDTYLDVVPIKITYHDGVGLKMNHPTNIGEMLSYAVFEIDVNLLLVQYKHWGLKRIELGYDPDPSVFVYTIILTNMIPDYLDISILNRFFRIGDDIESIDSTHRFNVHDNDVKTSKELERLMKKLVKKDMYYEEFLKSIPLITYKDSYDLLRLTSRTLNSNSLWSNYISRAEYTLLLIELLGIKGIRKNHNHLNDLNRIIRRLKLSKKMYSVNLLDNDVDILFTYERLVEITTDRSI